MHEAVLTKLERRLGRLHAKLRLGIEMDHEAQIFGQGINFFHIENWCSVHSVIRTTLKLMGLYWRGRKNAEQIQVRHNHISMKTLPSRTIIESTTLKRPRPKFPTTDSQSSCPIRRKSTGRPHMAVSICL